MRSPLQVALGVASAIPWKATPFNPLSFPLAVRTPYTSAWLPGGTSGGRLNGEWPQFWTGNAEGYYANLGWAGYVRVDGTPYVFLGDPSVKNHTIAKATQTASHFTSTQSIFTLDAGPVTLTANFLSPIEPTDLLRQSLPFAYFSVSAASNDNATHDVQVYSDISAEWASRDQWLKVNWTTTVSSGMTVHQVMVENQVIYGEWDDLARYGAAYYAVSGNCTYQTGRDAAVRSQFLKNGSLANTQDTKFRSINDDWPVFGHAVDLGSVGSTPTEPIVWAVGHARDPAIQYITKGNIMQDRRSYYFTKFSSMMEVLSFFLSDYTRAMSSANAFDTQIRNDALQISEDYANIVALSARQAFATTELTVGNNDTDIMLFMKEISSNGDINTVDVIFPAYPIFLYTNPALARYLLEPLFQYQESGMYPNKWCVHDIGTYPRAFGRNDGYDEKMPVEESGNILIMAAAYIKATNDTSLGKSYYNLLEQWTSFLISDSLIPAYQLSTDDFAGQLANQTNLAIKGIVGIAAMSQVAAAVGNYTASKAYLAIAESYVPLFQELATAANGTHLSLSYGDDSSWGLAYNLYADKLLGTDIFPQSIYDMQTAWYPKVAQAFGVPLDTRHTWTKSDWEIFTSAVMTTTTTRDLFIHSVAKYQQAGRASAPFPDLYECGSGNMVWFRNRPVAGGHFAHLALMKLSAGI